MRQGRRLSPVFVEPPMPRWWENFVMVLTVAAIALLVVDMQFGHDSVVSARLSLLDLGLCGVFLVDFSVRFHRARGDRLRFVKRNWPDLVGAIPLLEPLRSARLVRLVRLIRLTRLVVFTRRIAARYDLALPTRALTHLFMVSFAIWVVAATLFFYFEEGRNDGIVDIEDALWWSMTTLSTVGYGDTYPRTVAGRIVAASTMIVGVGVLGTLAATIASGLVEFRERGRRGLRRHMLKEHLLVLGWNERTLTAIDDFRHDRRYGQMPMVVVAPLESSPVEEPVRFVRGRPSHREALEKASAAQAAVSMVFAADPNDPRSDHETALAIHALRRLNPSVRIGAELVDPENREHLEAAGCDTVVSVTTIGATLLMRSVQDLGVCELVENILSNKGGSELHRVDVDPEDGPTYKDYVLRMMSKRRTVVALLRDGASLLHPAPTLALKEGDEAFLIAEEPR